MKYNKHNIIETNIFFSNENFCNENNDKTNDKNDDKNENKTKQYTM